MCFLLPGRAVPGSRSSRCNGRRHVGSAHRTKSKASLQAEFSHARAPPDRPPPPPPARRLSVHVRGEQLGDLGTPDFPGLRPNTAALAVGAGGGGPSTFPEPLPTPTRSQPPADATTRPSPGTQPRTPPANFEPQALVPATNTPTPLPSRPGQALRERPRLGDREPSKLARTNPAPPFPRSSIFSQVCLKVARRSDRPSLSPRTIVAFRL